ncbi:transcriptional regulator, BadM/Rrf2 family [Coriobacterium glomerans PW2]|uniref:Transcriptional regulator, BadM/Rrf2 family n=1 Tax=Coriobacterium glomerans (strain ATCC 49209 / DSM 20642 / JCM 10262 / PW2) TaxID=700015 RepID=F2NBK2_CORGP|nr:Rrf2 family transcriptional regulator [Coriobacterium glomerans]AEB06738.1 transcriptional regulator, BadM/Rrf2 family [Coriobacterium glomerans PW2]
MLVSTKGRHALRALVDLAEHQAAGYIPLKQIADRQSISEKYLESILSSLVQHGLLLGRRGRGGGYRLARNARRCTVMSVLTLTEGSISAVPCLEGRSTGCHRASRCRTLAMWEGLDSLVRTYLEGVTIADLMRSPKMAIAAPDARQTTARPGEVSVSDDRVQDP